MSFHLYAQENTTDGLRRILCVQIDNARTCLSDDGRLTDSEIHAARKSIKRARSTLRLLRPALTREQFRETNRRLRDTARPLTHVRDAKVLLDALKDLGEHFGDVASCMSTDSLENDLHSRRLLARRALSASSSALSQLRADLRKVGIESRHWDLRVDGWKLLRSGLKKIYRDGRKAFRKAGDAPTDERLHEWRKQVKHLWYALQIITPLRPGRLGELADQAHKLADYLGDDHDLAILRKQFREPLNDEDEASLEVLDALLTRRRGDFRDRAFAVGERLFAMRPRAFLRGLKRDWQRWSEEEAPQQMPPQARRKRVLQAAEPSARLH